MCVLYQIQEKNGASEPELGKVRETRALNFGLEGKTEAVFLEIQVLFYSPIKKITHSRAL